MAVSIEELRKLAGLARLRFSEDELTKFAGEFDEIIAFADTINRSVEGGTAAIRSVGAETVGFEQLRADAVAPSLPNEKILSGVEGEGGFFSVKRIKK